MAVSDRSVWKTAFQSAKFIKRSHKMKTKAKQVQIK